MRMQVYSQPGKVHSMLEALQREAVAAMLFLRSLERLEILEWHAGHAEPRALFECQIAASPQLRSARHLFSRAASPQAVGQDISGKLRDCMQYNPRSAAGGGVGLTPPGRWGVPSRLAGHDEPRPTVTEQQGSGLGPCKG